MSIHPWQRCIIAVGIASAYCASIHTAANAQCENEKIYAWNASSYDYYGSSVFFSGGVGYVAALTAGEGARSGGVYVYDVKGEELKFRTIVLPELGTHSGGFGSSMAILDDLMVVGAIYARFPDVSGAAYLFRYDGSAWRQEARIQANDARYGAHFGGPIVIADPDMIVVGAKDDAEVGYNAGAAYVFRRSGGQWIQTQKLSPSIAAAYQEFGISITIDGDRMAIGAAGPNQSRDGFIVLYEQVGNEWHEREIIEPDNAQPYDHFGSSVVLDGELLFVSATARDYGYNSGAVYVLRQMNGQWRQEARLLPENGGELHGPLAWTGAKLLAGGEQYINIVEADSQSGWSITARLHPSDGAVARGFGGDISLESNLLLVGASTDASRAFSGGSAYFFGLEHPPTSEPAIAVTLAVPIGTILSGGLPELATSDDEYLHARSASRSVSFDPNTLEIREQFETDAWPVCGLTLRTELHIDEPSGTMRVRLMDWTAGYFRTVLVTPIGPGDERIELDLDHDVDQFVRESDGRVLVSLKMTAPFAFSSSPFDAFIDELTMDVTGHR